MIKHLLVLSLLLEIIFASSAFILMQTRTGDCDLPELIGIIPGQTTGLEAEKIILALPQDWIDPSDPTIFSPNSKIPYNANLAFNLTSSPDEIALAFSSFDISKPIFSLGQFVDQGCQPTHVYRAALETPDPTYLLLTFGQDNRLALEIRADKAVSSDSPVYWVYILPMQDSQEAVDSLRNGCSCYDEVRWLGYASDEDYWAETPIQ